MGELDDKACSLDDELLFEEPGEDEDDSLGDSLGENALDEWFELANVTEATLLAIF